MSLFDHRTWCNPLSIPDIPRGTDSPLRDTWLVPDDYRSISDPTVLYWDGKWYLYPSYGMAWVSEDFVTWKHVPCTPPEARAGAQYSPAVTPWGDRFLMTIHSDGLFAGDTPTGSHSQDTRYEVPSSEGKDDRGRVSPVAYPADYVTPEF